MDTNSLNITNNSFGNNVTIYQGNIRNPVADQCLKDLRLTDPRDDKTRIQQTKGGLLKESSNWIFENETFKQWRGDEKNTLLWIKGDPGKGKTMLLCAIVDELAPTTKLAKPTDRTTKAFLSYFFCQGTDSRINNATAVLRGLIYLIIIQAPSLVSHVQEKYNHAGKALFLDVNAWVALCEMLQNILCDPKVGDIVLVLDALDECETDSAKLLDLITQHASLPHVKWIISSRNILSIQQRLEPCMSQGILSLELKRNAETVSNAVDIYIEHRISRLHSMQHDQDQRVELRDVLRQKANGTFLWVSLVVKELEDVQSWEVMEVVKEMPMDLAAVYRRMTSQIQQQRRGNAKFCWNILSTIFTAYYPLSLDELGVLSDLPKDISEHHESIKKLVSLCGSFLTIRRGIVYFIHQSAKDFLSTDVFQSDAARRHADIFAQSTTVISTLPQNIYRLSDFGFRSPSAPPPKPNPLAPMRYACFCWTDHFCDAYGATPRAELEQELKEKLWSFLKDNVLRWLEITTLLGRLPNALRFIQKILQELQLDTDSQLAKFLHSTKKFIINNGPLITRAPLQVYGSALVFSQTSSDINQQQWKERLPLIEDIKGVIKTNNALLQTIEGHAWEVRAVCFSLDGKAIASCCGSGIIRVWDAATGAIQHTLTTGTQHVLAISFSPDGKSVAFVADGKGTDFYLLKLITVSLDNKILSSRLDDSDIQLNAAIACGCSQILESTMPFSASAMFSLDGKMLATIRRRNDTIKLWNATTSLLLRAFQKIWDPDAMIYVLAFSPDSKTIATGHAEGAVNLWYVETGIRFQTFIPSHTHPFQSITTMAFQLDGKTLVLGNSKLSDNIRVLDIATGRDQENYMSYDERVYSIAFSPDGGTIAVGSSNGTIRLWDADLGMRLWKTGDTARLRSRSTGSKTIGKMIFSPDGKTLALSTFLSREVELWDTSKGTCQNTFQVSPLIFTLRFAHSQGGAIAFSPDSRTLALGCCGICLWDVATGWESRHPTLWGTHCTAIAFSPNGEQLASSLSGFEIQLQNMATGEVQRRFRKGADEVHAITFLPEGESLAAVYDTGLILVWDSATGARLQEFHVGHPWKVRYTSIKYLPDGPFLCLNHQYIINLPGTSQKYPKRDVLQIHREWITKGGKPLLWLPREYRFKVVVIQGNMMAIAHSPGITFIRFQSSVLKKL